MRWNKTSKTDTSLFPTDAFLKKYFGRNSTGKVRMDVGTTKIKKYDELRRSFDYVLRVFPNRIMRSFDRDEQGFEDVVLFMNGMCAEPLRSWLESDGVWFNSKSQQSEFETELFSEFVQYIQQNIPKLDQWWEYVVHDKSVVIRINSEANQVGGNRPKRKFDDIFPPDTEAQTM